jgi:hypothetical protein
LNAILELLRRYNIGTTVTEEIPYSDFMINLHIELADINFKYSNTKRIMNEHIFDDLYNCWCSDKRNFIATAELALYLFEKATFDNSYSESEKCSLLEI